MRAGDDPDPSRTSQPPLAAPGGRGLSARLRQRLPAPGSEVRLGVGDDAAEIRWHGSATLLAPDARLEGVHFRRSRAAVRDPGARVVAVSVSETAGRHGTTLGGGDTGAAIAVVWLPVTLLGRAAGFAPLG